MASLPEKFKINRAELANNDAYVSSDTRSLIYRQRRLTGQRWEFRIRSTKLVQSDIKSVMAGIGSIERQNATLELILPIFSDSTATTASTTQTRAIGQTSVTLDDVAGIEVGDFFNFTGHTKAYQVEDVTGLTVTFNPNLISSVASAETVTFNDCVFTCKIRGRPQRYSVTANDNSAILELDVVEAL